MPVSRPLREVVEILDVFAPPALAQDWDNVGLLVGNLDAPIRSASLCIDLMPPVVDEAVSTGVELVVAYHPPLFRPVSRLVFPSCLLYTSPSPRDQRGSRMPSSA